MPHGVTELLRTGGNQQFIHRHVGAGGFQRKDQIFRRDISGCAWGVGTAAEASGRSIKRRDSLVPPGRERVRDGHAIGVMEL